MRVPKRATHQNAGRATPADEYHGERANHTYRKYQNATSKEKIMICEHCHGTGGQINKRGCWIPCGACQGTTRGHCCEGMVGGPYEEAAQFDLSKQSRSDCKVPMSRNESSR